MLVALLVSFQMTIETNWAVLVFDRHLKTALKLTVSPIQDFSVELKLTNLWKLAKLDLLLEVFKTRTK